MARLKSLSGGQHTGGAAKLRLQMALIAAIATLTAFALVLGAAIVFDRWPYRPRKLNYIPLMIICLAACFVLGHHLLALLL